MWRRTLCHVMGCGAAEQAAPGLGEHRHHHPPVVRWRARRITCSLLDQTVEPTGQPARGQLEHIGEIAHAHRVVVGLGQVDEHLIVAEGEAVFGQVTFERGERSP